MEKWAKYNDRIEVSSLGNVKVDGIHKKLRPNSTAKPYLCFSLKSTRYLVHRLVAECFISNPKPNDYNQVNHIDGNKQNNKSENLEWVNNKLNQIHAFKSGLKDGHKGERNYFATLTEEKVKAIIRISKTTTFTDKEACKYFGIPFSNYREIKSGRHWELSAYRNLFE